MFKMKPNESIVEMFTRFTDVVNGLEGLGKKVCDAPDPAPKVDVERGCHPS